jgi:hypothetical protein
METIVAAKHFAVRLFLTDFCKKIKAATDVSKAFI